VLGIAEGIETALGALKRTGVPTWAAYSATLLEQFQPPETVKKIVIFGDNDESFTGQKSAFVLAHRLKREGFDVEVRIPDCVGTDWADEVSA
jgi:putative DNA primase/helicase